MFPIYINCFNQYSFTLYFMYNNKSFSKRLVVYNKKSNAMAASTVGKT